MLFFFFLMIRRPPRSTRMTHLFPTRRSSDLVMERTQDSREIDNRIGSLALGNHLLRNPVLNVEVDRDPILRSEEVQRIPATAPIQEVIAAVTVHALVGGTAQDPIVEL